MTRPTPSPLASHWILDPEVIFLNHGSFGACPALVLEFQQEVRRRLEREPVRFLYRELEGRLDEARERLADFLGAKTEDVAFVRNATEGINAVLRSLSFQPGDELLTTAHEYNASRNALEFAAGLSGARIVVADVPFPLSSNEEILEAILGKVSDRTRLLLIDHVTSATAVIFPLALLVREMESRGIDVLVDGAHAPGMLPVDLHALGAPFYAGNLHKWVCAPKGSGFLHVRRDRQKEIRPLAISHGANSSRAGRSRFLLEFDWTGTFDPSAWLSVPTALDVLASLHPDGWNGVMAANHALALRARDLVCGELGMAPPAPDSMLGSMASFPLPDGPELASPTGTTDPLYEALQDFRIEVPVFSWPIPPGRLLRISAQLYNDEREFEFFARTLRPLLER